MKVVVNRCFGGFELSDEAVRFCNKLGLDVQGSYDQVELEENEFRSHPTLVKVVECLGELANGSCAQLRVVEIPFDSTEGWYIRNHDGRESIEEEHQSW